MPIRRPGKDPRTKEQKEADADVLQKFEEGEFLKVDPSKRKAAIEFMKRKNQERREMGPSEFADMVEKEVGDLPIQLLPCKCGAVPDGYATNMASTRYSIWCHACLITGPRASTRQGADEAWNQQRAEEGYNEGD